MNARELTKRSNPIVLAVSVRLDHASFDQEITPSSAPPCCRLPHEIDPGLISRINLPKMRFVAPREEKIIFQANKKPAPSHFGDIMTKGFWEWVGISFYRGPNDAISGIGGVQYMHVFIFLGESKIDVLAVKSTTAGGSSGFATCASFLLVITLRIFLIIHRFKPFSFTKAHWLHDCNLSGLRKITPAGCKQCRHSGEQCEEN